MLVRMVVSHFFKASAIYMSSSTNVCCLYMDRNHHLSSHLKIVVVRAYLEFDSQMTDWKLRFQAMERPG